MYFSYEDNTFTLIKTIVQGFSHKYFMEVVHAYFLSNKQFFTIREAEKFLVPGISLSSLEPFLTRKHYWNV